MKASLRRGLGSESKRSAGMQRVRWGMESTACDAEAVTEAKLGARSAEKILADMHGDV